MLAEHCSRTVASWPAPDAVNGKNIIFSSQTHWMGKGASPPPRLAGLPCRLAGLPCLEGETTSAAEATAAATTADSGGGEGRDGMLCVASPLLSPATATGSAMPFHELCPGPGCLRSGGCGERVPARSCKRCCMRGVLSRGRSVGLAPTTAVVNGAVVSGATARFSSGGEASKRPMCVEPAPGTPGVEAG